GSIPLQSCHARKCWKSASRSCGLTLSYSRRYRNISRNSQKPMISRPDHHQIEEEWRPPERRLRPGLLMAQTCLLWIWISVSAVVTARRSVHLTPFQWSRGNQPYPRSQGSAAFSRVGSVWLRQQSLSQSQRQRICWRSSVIFARTHRSIRRERRHELTRARKT